MNTFQAKELAVEISEWLKNYTLSNGAQSLVIGPSGGVDSALCSTLCAMTGLPTWCVILPCHSKEEDTIRGNNHVNWLEKKYNNINRVVIDLSRTFDTFKSSLPEEYFNNLGFANTKSRLRMVTFYQIATVVKGLVVGTGNKVEDFGIGFFTKYGDGGVDISPIGDLYKSEVREMARALEILPELTEAIPTDGLWDDYRTDESQIGATYKELEWAMDYLSEKTNLDVLLTERQLKILEVYNGWHVKTAHKMQPIPIFRRNK
jgi:NAD+ synthase